MTIILVILFFSLLVIVHEAGHFFAAKKMGIRVDEFGIGYPPRLIGVYKDQQTKRWHFVGWSKKIQAGNEREKPASGTIYSLNLIPFGGFVRLYGENREDESKPAKDSFASKGALKRIIVLLAGVTANVALAMVLLSIMFYMGAPIADEPGSKVSLKNESVLIVSVEPGSPAEAMGLQPGDKIMRLSFQANEEAGIKPETIEVKNISQIQQFIKTYAGNKIQVAFQRRGKTLTAQGVPRSKVSPNEGSLGIGLMKVGIARYPWYQALKKGIVYSFQILAMIVAGLYALLKNLLLHGKSIGEVAGPVGIFRLSSQMASLGMSYFLHFIALLSLNLAVLNSFPFPALDGGRVLFILIEKVKGSPLNPKAERMANAIGFALLILLMVIVTVRDITKLF